MKAIATILVHEQIAGFRDMKDNEKEGKKRPHKQNEHWDFDAATKHFER